MAFYTPVWVRRLVKEEAREIANFVSKGKGSTFRDYVDSKMPFVLWLNISEIVQKVLEPNQELIYKYISSAFPKAQVEWAKNTVYNILLDSYKDTINHYIADKTYKDITDKELEDKLLALSNIPAGEVRAYLSKEFSKKYRVSGSLAKKNVCVMLISQNFTSVNFGTVFTKYLKQNLSKYDSSSVIIEDPKTGEYVDNPFYILQELFEDVTGKVTGKKQTFSTQLQNVGHVEVDVVSEADKKVKRGQLSPRFIQALVSVPNQPRVIQKLAAQFSKDTLQSTTRVMVRKKFSGRKMVFEMLVEHGFPVGIPESQLTNLMKSTPEKLFGPGQGLTAELLKNPNLLVDLETSKSAKQYITQNIVSLLKTGKPAPNYNSVFDETVKTPIEVVKVKLAPGQFKKKATPVPKKAVQNLPPAVPLATNLSALQALINSELADAIKRNMGTGSRSDILNLRTGRLAESARVERLTMGRGGMISAYYTYMKNPYATFSDGGRQEYPRSRDPKLLISKSIREIASKQVGDRLRAVVV